MPELRELVEKLTLNRAGRSVYYGLVEECKGGPGSFKPAEAAVAGVLSGGLPGGAQPPGLRRPAAMRTYVRHGLPSPTSARRPARCRERSAT